MEKWKYYYGFDLLKFVMALLVAARHMIQVFYSEDSRWRVLIGSFLSNLAVPVFFIIAGFLLFRKVPEGGKKGGRIVLSYSIRILKLYLLWSVIYWPIDIFNWYNGTTGIRETINHYLRSFLFSSTIAQLWYLPALMLACLIVWVCYRCGFKVWQLLILTGALFCVGCIGDNWYFTERMPMKFQEFIWWYAPRFFTMRNGLFYGTFYVCLGLWFAKRKKRLPFPAAALGAVVFTALMYREVTHCFNTNMVFTAAPAAVCLVELSAALKLKARGLYPRLRAMSEWIYLSHFYFFYFFSWTVKWNPLPLTERNIALSVFVPMLLFAWVMARLAEKEKFAWVKKLI